MTRVLPFARALAATGCLMAPTAQALVIRHDTPTLDYENYGKWQRFDASCAIVRGDDTSHGISGATAIDSRWAVDARHTLKHVQDYMDTGKTTKLRGSKWSGWNNQGLANVNISRVIFFDDDFTRFANAIDIALVKTAAPCSALRIAPLYSSWDEVGRVGSGASASNNRLDGQGNDRKPEAEATSNSNRWKEVRWAGKNEINQVNGQALGSPGNALLKSDFDHPTNQANSVMGGKTAIDLEYGTMSGDSGSPVYADKDAVIGMIAGVLSGATGNDYGSTSVYVRIRPYRNWITDTILANPDTRTLSLTTIPNQTVQAGSTLSLTAIASSSDSPPLAVSYRLVNPPSGATIDSATGAFSWTPGASFAGMTRTITIEASEDGVVGNTATTSFQAAVGGSSVVTFWNWSTAPPNWGAVTLGGGSAPYNLSSAAFPYLQGNQNTLIYQAISGTIPAWAEVTVRVKIADFHQTWSDGGPVSFGFFTEMPTAANAASTGGGSVFPYASPQVTIPNFDNATELADGFANAGGDDEYSFSFTPASPLTNPYFVVRKQADGDRFGVDDVSVTYIFPDADADGLANAHEAALGTNPNLADTDGDALGDGAEVAAGTDPLDPDSDDDGYADGHEELTLGTSPLDPDSPDGPDTLAIGINFIAGNGSAPGTGLPPNARGGAPDVAQRNWNQTAPLSGSSGTTAQIATPVAGTLVDSRGMPTGATLAFAMANPWSADNEDLTPYGKLFAGYLDSNATTNCSVTVNNIPYAAYDVHVYFGADVNGRTGRITDGATTYSLTTASQSATAGHYLRSTDTGAGYPAANHAVFSGKSGPSLTLTYLRGSGNGGIQALQIVAVDPPTAYELWATGHGLDPSTDGAPQADADSDGVKNLVEFALHSPPGDPAGQPVLQVARNGNIVTFTYVRAKAADALDVSARWSANLVDWSVDGMTEAQVGETPDTRTIRASLDVTGLPACFFHIGVAKP